MFSPNTDFFLTIFGYRYQADADTEAELIKIIEALTSTNEVSYVEVEEEKEVRSAELSMHTPISLYRWAFFWSSFSYVLVFYSVSKQKPRAPLYK